MVPEASWRETDVGRVPEGEGWFVLDARDATWWHSDALGTWCNLEGDQSFADLGFQLVVLDPGRPACMYHGESNQEDFLVVAGECLLVIEGEERPLKQWDFVHCPPWAEHVFVGAGDGPCAIVMVGTRKPGAAYRYPVSEVAERHGASVEAETATSREAYARFPEPELRPYRAGDLPS